MIGLAELGESNERFAAPSGQALTSWFAPLDMSAGAVSRAVQIGLISPDNPEYQDMRIKFGRQEAERLVEDLPGGPDLYGAIADVYLEARQPVSA